MTAHTPTPTWFSLSHPLRPGIPTFPGDPALTVTPYCSVADSGYALHTVMLGSQSGTHIDTPAHFYTAGSQLQDFPLQRFITRARILDLKDAATPGQPLPTAAFTQLPAATAEVDTVLVRTGWDQHWGTDTYFKNPYFTATVATALLHLGYRTFGCDLPSPDPCESSEFPFHKTYLAATDSLIIENLTGFAELRHGEIIDLIFLPAQLGTPDGSPVQAIARKI